MATAQCEHSVGTVSAPHHLSVATFALVWGQHWDALVLLAGAVPAVARIPCAACVADSMPHAHAHTHTHITHPCVEPEGMLLLHYLVRAGGGPDHIGWHAVMEAVIEAFPEACDRRDRSAPCQSFLLLLPCALSLQQ